MRKNSRRLFYLHYYLKIYQISDERKVESSRRDLDSRCKVTDFANEIDIHLIR